MVRERRQKLMNEIAMSTVNLNEIITGCDSTFSCFSKALDAVLDFVDSEGVRKSVVTVISFVGRSYDFPTTFAFRNDLTAMSSSRNIRRSLATSMSKLEVIIVKLKYLNANLGSMSMNDINNTLKTRNMFITPNTQITKSNSALSKEIN